MNPETDNGVAERSLEAALSAVSELSRKVTADAGSLEEALGESVRSLAGALGLGALVVEASVGGEELRVSAGEAYDPWPLEIPVLRDRLQVGRVLAFASSGESSEGAGETLASVAGVISLAISAVEAEDVAARRSAQTSAVQLASEALSRTLDETRIYRTVLALAIELLGARAGAVFAGEAEPAAESGFEKFPETLEALLELEPLRSRGWRGPAGGGYAIGVPAGRDGCSIFLFRQERAYEESDLTSLRLVARQLSYARERGRLYGALEQRDLEVIQTLSAALESRDGTTGEHIGRTQRLVEAVALELGLEPEAARVARYAAVLHDIGKIGVPDAVLNKPGPLTDEEWEIMRRHPAAGADILAGIAGFERISEVVLSHHERFGGGGYPRGLAGESIPVEARIISVIDAYDAMTSRRPYKEPMSHETVLGELERNSGSQFDPRVVEAIERVLGHGLVSANHGDYNGERGAR